MVRVTFLLDEAEHNRLNAAATSRGVPKAAVLRDLIDKQLPRNEPGTFPRWKVLLQELDVEPLDVSVDEYLYGEKSGDA